MFGKVCNLQPHIKNPLQHIVLKKLSCVFICCSFLLSITPKQVLHFMVANHKDSHASQPTGTAEVGAAGFHCDCNSIVATSPFTEPFQSQLAVAVNAYHPYISLPSKEVLSLTYFYYRHRGPPALS